MRIEKYLVPGFFAECFRNSNICHSPLWKASNSCMNRNTILETENNSIANFICAYLACNNNCHESLIYMPNQAPVRCLQWCRQYARCDWKPYEIRSHSCRKTLFFGKLLMRRRSRMNRESLCVSDVCDVGNELEWINEFFPGLDSSLDAEAQNAACSIRKIFFTAFFFPGMNRVRGNWPMTRFCFFQASALRQGHFVSVLSFSDEGFRVLNEQKWIERRDCRSHVAQKNHARLDDVGDIADIIKRFHEIQIMVACVGSCNQRKLSICPVKLPWIDDDSTHRGSMSADILCRGVDDDVSAELNWTEKIRRTGVSTIRGMPFLWARSASASISVTLSFGFPIDRRRSLLSGE